MVCDDLRAQLSAFEDDARASKTLAEELSANDFTEIRKHGV